MRVSTELHCTVRHHRIGGRFLFIREGQLCKEKAFHSTMKPAMVHIPCLSWVFVLETYFTFVWILATLGKNCPSHFIVKHASLQQTTSSVLPLSTWTLLTARSTVTWVWTHVHAGSWCVYEMSWLGFAHCRLGCKDYFSCVHRSKVQISCSEG